MLSPKLNPKVRLYMVLVFLLSLPSYYFIISTGKVISAGKIILFFTMLIPSIAAITTCLVYNRNLKGLGWGWGKTRYQFLSFTMPLFLSLLVYSFVWMSGLGNFQFSNFALKADEAFGLSANLSTIVLLLSFSVIGMTIDTLAALGEEIGWRGLFVMELAKDNSFIIAAFFSGCIWAIWHFPGIIFADYNNPGTPIWYDLICFSVMIISMSFVMTWIRIKSGSLWTAAIFHGSHNLFIQALMEPITIDSGVTMYLTTEFGAGMAIVYTAAAVAMWKFMPLKSVV